MRRGKSIEWTIDQDKRLLAGERVEGTTVQVVSRRYRLKTNYLPELGRYGKKFLERLKHLVELDIAPKSASKKFLDNLSGVIEDLNNNSK